MVHLRLHVQTDPQFRESCPHEYYWPPIIASFTISLLIMGTKSRGQANSPSTDHWKTSFKLDYRTVRSWHNFPSSAQQLPFPRKGIRRPAVPLPFHKLLAKARCRQGSRPSKAQRPVELRGEILSIHPFIRLSFPLPVLPSC